MHVELESVCLAILTIFVIAMLCGAVVFLYALFKFPTLRHKIWHGITNGDLVPHQDDFQRTAQLFFAFVFGTGLVCCFLLWAAYPSDEWRIIVPAISVVFLGCIGLRSFKHHSN
jgi:hypothetical protein